MAKFHIHILLGSRCNKNLYWPTLSLAETIYVPGISNFKLVFIFLWNSIVFQTIANQSYFSIIHCPACLKNKL